MDVIIVTTASSTQCCYWQQRLDGLKGILTDANSIVIFVEEDWEGAAGQALGTLYAYYKAGQQLKQLYNSDLYELQKGGASIAIYHTVGRGQRLYPLAASEGGNKSALKLPSMLLTAKTGRFTMSVLEAVIVQSRALAPFRKGRLSVFWGDQIFLPSEPISKSADAAIDIYIKKSGMPTLADWNAQEWYKYGFIALRDSGEAQLLEKSPYPTVQALLQSGDVSVAGGAGISMGSFSLSAAMTAALLREFEKELQSKCGFIDSDSGLWMPMTLNRSAYSLAMQQLGLLNMESHYRRMQKFKERFLHEHPSGPFFQATDVGQDCFWWDYGSVKAYYDRLSTLTGRGAESTAMRQFFQLEKAYLEKPKNVQVDEHSLLIDCRISSGVIRNSVLVGVRAESLDIADSVIVDSDLNRFKGRKCLLYNVLETGPLEVEPGEVRADLDLPESLQHLKLYTELGRDGKKDWKINLKGNGLSWADLEKLVRES